MKKKSTWILILLAVLILLISVLLFTMNRNAGLSTSAPPEANVIRLKATVEDITNTIEVKGKSSYAEEENVYAPFASEIESWEVQEGSQVKKGQVLFRMEDSELQNSIALSRANIEKQELEVKLSKMRRELSEENGETQELGDKSSAFEEYAGTQQSELEARLSELQLDVARRELEANERKLALSAYKAPSSGIFLFGEEKEPKLVEDQDLLGRIVDLSKLQLISTVSEYEVFKIKEGMEADIRADAFKDLKLKGVVQSVSKFAKAGADSAQFEVVISLDNSEGLIAGLSLTGSIVTDRKEGAVVVPTLAVMREDDEYYVYVEQNGVIERRTVELGLETPDKTEIVSGVAEGDTIVLQ
ncbi:efflux RND transporter periplasmic adaptor subunit [Paenibacillus thailandensis]|uniref:Efflux RND transporter periplasmic adaptor subunit n=1 Tax=Paenibacillus thailandensis TaxID=393250 RepID=A0ABW5QSK8_9BACL